MSWRDLEAGAPELARRGQERLEQVGLALLGTLRRDGSPRISPVEPHVVGGRLLLAAMPRSAKARDLRRDARCTLHSAVSDPEGADGELKLFGGPRRSRTQPPAALPGRLVGVATRTRRARLRPRDRAGRVRELGSPPRSDDPAALVAGAGTERERAEVSVIPRRVATLRTLRGPRTSRSA